MLEIALTGGGNKAALIDDEDLHLVEGRAWVGSARNGSGKFYAHAVINGRTVYMHRLIMGAGVGDEIDHINGDSLDNRRVNLRFCTRAQNNFNRRFDVGKSGYRGVHLDAPGRVRPYRARVSVGRRRVRSVYFSDPAEAALEYDVMARKYFGEFAILNFPEQASPIFAHAGGGQ